jgi:TIR domain-containing protein
VKIFISYSSIDKTLAESVHGEMVSGGAESFEFSRSAAIGRPSWEQVLDWISDSDAFIVLLSKSALESKPVREEIAHAHYSYINSDKPSRIVSAILDKSIAPPRLIARFTTLDLCDYDEGMDKLMPQLGLTRRPRAKPAPLPLSDLALVFKEFKRSHPGPTAAERFSKDAETILTNYDALKPAAIKDRQGAKHVDEILFGLSNKERSLQPTRASKDHNKWFLGYEPEQADASASALAESLLHWKPSAGRQPLDAPRLSGDIMGLRWTAVAGATGYAVESSRTSSFFQPEELYRGSDTSFIPPPVSIFEPSQERHYRVKALGGVFKPDSQWSNVYAAQEPKLDFTLNSLLSRPWKPLDQLPAPSLSATSDPFTVQLRWTAVDGANRYVVQRSVTPFFATEKAIYDGPLTSCGDRKALLTLTGEMHYRVKASGSKQDSEWSNVVKCRAELG